MPHHAKPDRCRAARGRRGPVLLALWGAFLLLAAPAHLLGETVVYEVDPDHSGVTFTIRHFVGNVPGRFNDFDGTVRYDRENPAASSVELTIRVASVDTGNDDRDSHLRSADFFDVERFPTMTFTGVSAEARDADTVEVTGDLTLHGVTRRIAVPVAVLGTVRGPRGEKAGFEVAFTLRREDYGIVWNRVLDEGGAVLGDDVKVVVYIEADRHVDHPGR